MVPQRKAIGSKTAALSVIAIIVLVAIGLSALYDRIPLLQHSSISTTIKTSSTTTIRTCTAIPAISFMYCGSPLRISAYGEPGASPFGNSSYEGSWNFTVSISSNSVVQGQSIQLVADLTNVGPQNVTIKEFVKPFVNPAVYAIDGTILWQWNPSQSTWPNVIIASGQTISQDVSIPTSQLRSGQLYLIQLTPLSIQFPHPNNMTFTFQVSVQ